MQASGLRRQQFLGSASQRSAAQEQENPRGDAPADWSTWTKKTYEVSSASRGLLQRLPQVLNKKISVRLESDSLSRPKQHSRFASCDSRLGWTDSTILLEGLSDRELGLSSRHKALTRPESTSQLIQDHSRRETERIGKQRALLARRVPVRTEPVTQFDSKLPSQRFLPTDKPSSSPRRYSGISQPGRSAASREEAVGEQVGRRARPVPRGCV